MNQENQNDFNLQGNNDVPNNQPLNSQDINQDANINQQPITQGPIPQSINTFEGGAVDNQNININSPKKINLGLIIGIVTVVVVATIGIVFGSKILSNKEDDNKNNNFSKELSYYDKTRSIKSTYTFDEAISKFAFKEYETTLVFQQNNNVKLSNIKLGNISNISFYYEKENSYFTFTFEESGSSNINEFVGNFKSGILGGGKRQTSFENIKILETNDEYVFISCQESGNSSYKYYFAKQIGNKVFFAYSNRNLTELNDNKKSEMLNGFKELFSTLSSDDNKEPYISDKILNVPVVLNKQIKSYEFIDWEDTLNTICSSLSFTDTFINGFNNEQDAVMKNFQQIRAIGNEISDGIMDSWNKRNTSFDIMSQKQSDATLGYERVYDTKTNEIYKAYNGFNDEYDGERYKPVTDDMYLQKTSGYIEK